MRRAILFLLAVLILLLGGVGLWHASGCMIVGGQFCTEQTTQLDLSGRLFKEEEKVKKLQNLEELNLRDSGLTVEAYDRLCAALPNCRIYWSIPFQGKRYPENTTHLSVSTVSREDLDLLGYFGELESIDAIQCQDMDTVTALMNARPDCRVDYKVPLEGSLVDKDSATPTFGSGNVESLLQAPTLLPKVREVDATAYGDYKAIFDLQQRYPDLLFRYTVQIGGSSAAYDATALTVKDPDPEELDKALSCLPKLQTLTRTGKLPANAQLHTLQLKYPQVSFRWSFSLCGVTVNTMDEKIDLSGLLLESTALVEEALPCFNGLKTVDMCGCGISTADMAALAERNPQIRFIWEVSVGKIRLRTDAQYLMPYQHDASLTDADTAELKYCVDMLCLDFGHSEISDISFTAYMPKLKYLLLGETKVKDISPLAGLEELVYVELFMSRVKDYSPLISCPNLEDLNVCYAIPGDLSALCSLKQLKTLHIKGLWSLSHRQQLRNALPDTTIVFSDTGDISSTGDGWRKLQNYYDMRDLLNMPYMSS